MGPREITLLATLTVMLSISACGGRPQSGEGTQAATQPSAQGPFRWTSIGPTIIAATGNDYDKASSSGRVSALVLTSTQLIAATANGGIWARPSSAGPWFPMTEGLANLSFGAIAVAPTDPKILYAATGEAHDCIDCGSGDDIYRSTDAGQTWIALKSVPNTAGAVAMQSAGIAVDPVDPNTVWTSNTLGVFRSDNGGQSWSPIWSSKSTSYWGSANPPIVDLKLDPKSPSVAYFTDRRYIWKFDPKGTPQLTNSVSVPKPTQYAEQNPETSYVIAIAFSPSKPDTMYASYAYSGNFRYGCLAGLYRSDNHGATWHEISVKAAEDYFSSIYGYGYGTGCQGWYDNVISVDPLNENDVVVGGIVTVNIDSTSLTSPVITNLTKRSGNHPDQHTLLFDASGNLYVGSDGGVWRYPHAALSSNSSEQGENLSSGLVVTQFSQGGTWLRAGALLAGSQDNGTELYSSTAGQWQWTRVAMGDGGYTGVSARNSSVIYHEYYQGTIERSVDLGHSWITIMPPFISTGAVAWVMPYLVDPAAPDTLVAGADGEVFVTSSGGLPANRNGQGTWAVLKGSDSTGLGTISSIDQRGSAAQLIAGDINGLVAWTLDSGAHWTTWQAPAATGYQPPYEPSVDLVQFDANDSNVMYVAYSYADSPFTPHLVRVQTLNANPPQDYSSGLGAPVRALLQTEYGLFAGTDRGVYFRNTAGQSWTRDASDGKSATIPSVPVVDLKLQPGSDPSLACIVALTHGRGAWRSNAIKYVTGQAQ